jgi:glycosyltransferase involved in cell wall biosynthesis
LKPSVLYITNVYFLDAALEYINEVKEHIKLDVLVEINSASKHANILNIEKLPEKGTFFQPDQILDQSSYSHFRKYIDKCNSFHFFVHQNPRSISLSSIKKSFILDKFINKLEPDYVHFDDVSVRLTFLTFLRNFKRLKLILNVHDPVQHSGEKNKKILFARYRFYPKAYKFVTFSKYSKMLFEKEYDMKQECVSLYLKPYLFFRNFMSSQKVEREYFTFVGRVSEYKGVDLFLDAIAILNKKYPSVKYRVAGIPVSTALAERLKSKYSLPNVEFIFRHIENEEMVSLIQRSKAIVCPYKDATQSGVVMTAMALDTKIIVTDQGGLPEYINSDSKGKICKPDADSIADSIESIMNSTDTDEIDNIQKIENEYGFSKKNILLLYS